MHGQDAARIPVTLLPHHSHAYLSPKCACIQWVVHSHVAPGLQSSVRHQKLPPLDRSTAQQLRVLQSMRQYLQPHHPGAGSTAGALHFCSLRRCVAQREEAVCCSPPAALPAGPAGGPPWQASQAVHPAALRCTGPARARRAHACIEVARCRQRGWRPCRPHGVALRGALYPVTVAVSPPPPRLSVIYWMRRCDECTRASMELAAA